MLHIGFVTVHIADDRRAYSGSAYAMRKALASLADVHIHDIDGLRTYGYPIWRGKQAFYHFCRGTKYWMNREASVLRGYASQVNERTSAIDRLDVLLSPSSIPLAYYEGPLPTVIWTDATFDSLLDFYPNATGLCDETIRAGHAMERRAIHGASLAVYSSEWARSAAICRYDAEPSRVKMVPYGANLDDVPQSMEICSLVESRLENRPRILFVGVDWHRKGGDIAVAAVEEMRQRGIMATLDIVGSSPGRKLPAFATSHGVLDIQKTVDRARLTELYRSATLSFLPTQADCMPVVVAESCAFGLPVIASNVGGIGTGIVDQQTGRLLAPGSSPCDWAEAAVELVACRTRYATTSMRARELYEQTLNWSVAARTVITMIEDQVTFHQAA